MSRTCFVLASQCVSFPRVSGDEPVPSPTRPKEDTFSPRERG